MAASRATVVQSLSIALIVFVMLTFVLAITTYLFFKQQVDEQAKADAAVAEATKSKGELNTALEEKKKLQEIIGLAEDKTAADVEADTTETFSSKFSDFQEDPKNYKNLSEWLKKAIEAKDKTLQEKDAEIAKEKAAAVAAAEEADKARKQLEEKVAEREKEAAGLKQSFDADRAKAEQRQEELVAAQKAALDRATKLEQINAEIAKGEAFLSSSRQTRFKGQPPEARVGLFFEELRDNEKVIQRQNTLLADLRAADKALQDTVLDAVPKNEREEGFDGRIVSINEVDRTVLIDFRSTAAIRPGLLFAVYDPTDPQPELAAKKGTVEVVGVESASVARARVLRDSVSNPILAGDAVATSLWKVSAPLEVVVVGFVQLDRDSQPDPDRLQELIGGIGGRVEQSVGPGTTMLVDAGEPKTIGRTGERLSGWRPADDSRREKQLKEARRLGIRIISLDAFLQTQGLDRDALEANRLERPGDIRTPPARDDRVAF
jgi:hypothetical protein